ncbi:MAG TPA: hypothetical protein VI933_02970 [archaeon]|nr:hypothetical protein [archaeon]
MPRNAHSISLNTRRQIWEVIRLHGLNPDMITDYGLIDRMIRGQLLCETGKVKIGWNPSLQLDDEQWPVTVNVDSASRDGQKYFVGVLLTKVPDEEVEAIHRALIGRKVYEIRDVGGEINYKKRGGTTKIPAHACEDGFFQQGIKTLPGVCMHRVAAAMFVYDQAGRGMEAEGVSIIPRYLDMGEDLIGFYKELEGRDLKAAQRLDLLYGFSRGLVRTYRTGTAFMESVKPFLERQSS